MIKIPPGLVLCNEHEYWQWDAKITTALAWMWVNNIKERRYEPAF